MKFIMNGNNTAQPQNDESSSLEQKKASMEEERVAMSCSCCHLTSLIWQVWHRKTLARIYSTTLFAKSFHSST